MKPIYKVIDKIRSYPRPMTEYIKASTDEYIDGHVPENVLDTSTKIFHSNNSIGSYLKLEFIRTSVYIEYIKLQIPTNQDPMNWKIEGTDINNKNVELYDNVNFKMCEDFRSDNSIDDCYCNYYANRTFEVKKGTYKDIKITLTGHSSCGTSYLILNQIEILGRISNDNSFTCKSKQSTSIKFIFYIILSFYS